MATAVVTAVLDATADAVWSRVRDFGRWDAWIERITRIEMDSGQESAPVGAVRTVHVTDRTGSHSIRERLVSQDNRLRTLAYEFPEDSSFPVRSYLGTVHVEDITTSPGQAYLRWTGDFDADGADEDTVGKTFSAIYEAFIRDLAADLAAADPAAPGPSRS
jgi:fatty-acyl-CoA synthase